MDREAGERYDDEVPAGHVLRQRPASGSLVKRGGRVEVAVSLGPQVVAVPDLDGADAEHDEDEGEPSDEPRTGEHHAAPHDGVVRSLAHLLDRDARDQRPYPHDPQLKRFPGGKTRLDRVGRRASMPCLQL